MVSQGKSNKRLLEIKKFVIEGDPIPLKRARHGNRRTWDSQKALKQQIRLILDSQHTTKELYTTPIHIQFIFFMKIPKVGRGKLEGRPHHYRPDLSNLIKFIEDVGTGVLYTDDSLIWSINSKKQYDANPRTEITITPLELQ